MAAAAAQSPVSQARVHTVRPGETLGRIAKRYRVTIEQLRAWNPSTIRAKDRIQPGSSLVIQAQADNSQGVTPAPDGWQFYTIQGGDTLTSIAANLDLSVTELLLANRLSATSRLRQGDRLRHRRPVGSNDSQSEGSPQHGRLAHGVQLPEGDKLLGYVRRFPENSWGTWQTVRHIQRCAAQMRLQWPDTVPVVIGDISRPQGGRLRPHHTHQSGRDVDIGYYLKHNVFDVHLRPLSADDLALKKTWALMSCFIETGEVRRILMDHGLQQALHRYLLKRLPAERLAALLQYPRPKREDVGLIRHSAGHRSHFHVQFACPSDDPECRTGKL